MVFCFSFSFPFLPYFPLYQENKVPFAVHDPAVVCVVVSGVTVSCIYRLLLFFNRLIREYVLMIQGGKLLCVCTRNDEFGAPLGVILGTGSHCHSGIEVWLGNEAPGLLVCRRDGLISPT